MTPREQTRLLQVLNSLQAEHMTLGLEEAMGPGGSGPLRDVWIRGHVGEYEHRNDMHPAAGTWRLPQVGPEGYRTQGKLGFRSKPEMVVWAVRNSLLDDELPPWVSRAGKAAGARQTGGVNESGVLLAPQVPVIQSK